MNKLFDDAAETIGNMADLNDDQKKLVKMGLIVVTVYFGARYVRSLFGKK